MNKKLNILFLSSWYPSRVFPTLGNFVQKHAEAVALQSNVIALNVCSDETNKETYELVTEEINNVLTINVYYKKINHSFPIVSQLQKVIRYIKAHRIGLQKVQQQFVTIDLIHHNKLYPAGIVAWYLKKTKHIPYIITEHWTGYLASKKTHRSLVERILSKIIAKNADCIAPVSKNLGEAMQQLGLKNDYEVIYNVTDTQLFHPLETTKTHDKIKIIHISTLDDLHKNISGMLRVAKDLSEKRTDFEIWFIGDGDTTPHIATAKKLNIYNTVAFFDGTKTTSEVASIMRTSDCFLLFSNYENLPCVIVEALASGIPIISSDVGGIPEHITEPLGALVKAGDEKALLQTLNNVIDKCKHGFYQKNVLSKYAQEHFSYKKVGEKYQDLYHRILNKNRPS